MSQSSDCKQIVSRLSQNLQLDQASLEEPGPETKKVIRCLARQAKCSHRDDVVKHLREIVPAGTTGMLSTVNRLFFSRSACTPKAHQNYVIKCSNSSDNRQVTLNEPCIHLKFITRISQILRIIIIIIIIIIINLIWIFVCLFLISLRDMWTPGRRRKVLPVFSFSLAS